MKSNVKKSKNPDLTTRQTVQILNFCIKSVNKIKCFWTVIITVPTMFPSNVLLKIK